MPVTNNKQETTLAYKVDARGLKELKKEMDKSFDTKKVKELKAQADLFRSSLKKIAEEQARLTRALAGVAEGSKAYKELEKQLNGVEKAANRVRSAITTINAATQRSAKQGAFSQGFLQGLSPVMGQFIQRDEGMRRQFAGQMIGGGIRGAVAGSFGRAGAMLQGAGPLSTLMSGIPVLGGIAAAAEGQAGNAMQFYRNRLAAAPFVSGLGGGHYEKAKLLAPTLAGAGPGADTTSQMLPFADRHVGASAQDARRRARAAGLDEDMVERLGIHAAAAARSKVSGQSMVPAKATHGGYAPGGDDAFLAAGHRSFLTQQESMEAVGQNARTVGSGFNAGMMGQIEAARAAFGVDRGVGAGFFRQQGAGRGGSSMLGQEALAGSIGDAMKQGLEGSEISDYLEQLVQLQQQAERQGIKVSSEGFGELARGFSALGMAGPQGGRLAGELQGFGARVAGSGARGPMDIALLRNLGFDAGKGGDSYIDALMKAEKLGSGGMDAHSMFGLVSQLSGGGNAKRGGFALQRALGGAGVKLGLGQAVGLAGAAQGGEAAFMQALSSQGFMTTGPDGKRTTNFGTMSGDQLTGALNTPAMRDLSSAIRAQNSVDDQLLSAGKEILPNVLKLQMAASNLTDAVGKLSQTGVVNKVTDSVVKISDLLTKLIDLVEHSNLKTMGAGF